MKVLLTGASGFVGSHILESLRARSIPTVVLLRPTSSMKFIGTEVEIRNGSITNKASLPSALEDITHIIHCAGATKARNRAGFFEVNQGGTRNLVDAINSNGRSLQRFLLISSLAAVGPAMADKPARENDSPHPVSAYGESKLAAEQEVRTHCRSEFVILRPPAVYGPRDVEFLRLFKAIKMHLMPRSDAKQTLSLVFVKDLAEAVVTCVSHASAGGKTYFVANREVVTARSLADEIGRQVKTWTLPLPLPKALMWFFCLIQELITRVTGKANVLSLEKFAELRAPSWVCDPTSLEREVGFQCSTSLSQGIAQTLVWYRKAGWL